MSAPPDTPSSAFAAWLSTFATAIIAADSDSVAALFLPNGWFRDILTLTWDFRALRGPEKISAHLKEHARPNAISNIKLDEDPYLLPHYVPGSGDNIIEAAFLYETPIGLGRGYAQLVGSADSGWYALVVCMTLTDLKGHEEPRDPLDWETEAQGRAYGDFIADRRRKEETDTYVLIGQCIHMLA